MKPFRFVAVLLVLLILLILSILSISSILLTDVYAEEEERKWTDEAELSFVDTSGNTEVTTFSAKNTLKYAFTKRLDGTWMLAALYGETDGTRDAENYASEWRLDYGLTKRLYSFAAAGWYKDQFSGIDARYYVGPGMGYKLLTGPGHFLSAEAGLNYTKEEYTDDTKDEYLTGRTFAKYQYAFTKRNRFSQSLEFLYNFEYSDRYKLNSETAVISSLTDLFSLKTSYVVKYNNEPVPATLDKTDTILSAALVVSF